MTCAILEIVYGDAGDRKIALVGSDTVFLRGWNPGTPAWTRNATFYSGALADGRRLASRKFDNTFETMNIDIKAHSPDAAAAVFRDVENALEQLANYWVSPGEDSPVYLKVQTTRETNPRYAVLVSYQLGNLNNPFATPFLQPGGAALIQFELVLERLNWQEHPPGTVTVVERAGYQTYDGRTLGNVDENGTVTPSSTQLGDTGMVFVAGRHVRNNLTDVYYYDDSLATYSANLLDAALPHDLIPSTAAINDYLLFGIDDSIAGAGPFFNLIFNISSGILTLSITWEYWDGTAWSALSPFNDGTAGFTEELEQRVWFPQPDDWATRSENGITGWWVRARISAFTSVTDPPLQQTRHIYTVQWGFAEVEADQVTGDIPALARHIFWHHGSTILQTSQLVMGLRSYSRGANFQAFINASDDQEPTSITVTGQGGALLADEPRSPSGRMVQSTTTPAAFTEAARFAFAFDIAPDFYGTFRLFARARCDDIAEAKLRAKVLDATMASTLWQSDVVRFADTDINVLDMGVFTVPSHGLLNSEGIGFGIEIEFGDDGGGATIDLHDIVLIPIDEWAAELNGPSGLIVGNFTNYTYLDGAINPKVPSRSYLFDFSGTQIEYLLQETISGPPILQPNARQRLWVLPIKTGGNGYSSFETSLLQRVAIDRLARYLTLRGSS